MYRDRLSPEESWERNLTREMDACIDSGGSDDCIMAIGFQVYEHYSINIYEVANARLDNPLPPDSYGFRLLAPRAMVNWNDGLFPTFLDEVGVDPLQPTNYEHTFLEVMKRLYPEEYWIAVEHMKGQEEFIEYFEKYGFEQIFGSAYEHRPGAPD